MKDSSRDLTQRPKQFICGGKLLSATMPPDNVNVSTTSLSFFIAATSNL
ncbi:MAG: hypothetical protein L0I48_05070 [Lactococcus plantarum]|nr:hypothetical protein [Lactococcus plantarum]MDN6070550.1 hypothetical protein [Lactococcus plantarum]